MSDNTRAHRLAKRIVEIVATAIEHEIKDPRLEFITITDARVTGDLREATVYYTVRGVTLEEEPDVASAEAALTAARGRLRTIVGARTGIKFTPSLSFATDTVPDAAREMNELLARAKAQDEQVRQQSQGAKPAGESDPYKQ